MNARDGTIRLFTLPLAISLAILADVCIRDKCHGSPLSLSPRVRRMTSRIKGDLTCGERLLEYDAFQDASERHPLLSECREETEVTSRQVLPNFFRNSADPRAKLRACHRCFKVPVFCASFSSFSPNFFFYRDTVPLPPSHLLSFPLSLGLSLMDHTPGKNVRRSARIKRSKRLYLRSSTRLAIQRVQRRAQRDARSGF